MRLPAPLPRCPLLGLSISVLGALSSLCGLPGCEAPPWQITARDAAGWVLAVSATPDRILAVGGQPGTGGQPGQGAVTVVRGAGDGQAGLSRLPSPRPGMLWWVHALSPRVAWLAGEAGVVLRYDEGDGEGAGQPELRTVATGTATTLYGVWAFSDEDVWAVGGDEGQGGVVLHGGLAAGLQAVPGVPRTGVLFKVYGADPQHLFLVGAAGALLRSEGQTFVLDPPLIPANERLLTVHGRGTAEVYAVGGAGQGRVLRWDGLGWSVVPTPGLVGLNGVFVSPKGDELLVAGQRGLLATRRGDGPFTAAELPAQDDLHAVFALGAERFAVGGNLSQFGIQPPRGVLLHQGRPPRTVAAP